MDNTFKQRLEDNEDKWFSLWCESFDLGEAFILYNKYFPEDPLYNHATRVHSNNKRVENLIQNVANFYQSRYLIPSFIISPLSLPIDIEKHLLKSDFRFYDYLHVMVLTSDSLSEQNIRVIQPDLKMSRVTSSGEIISWVQVFTKSFDIPESWFHEIKTRTIDVVYRSDVHLILGYTDRKPVGVVAIFNQHYLGGIYCLGTLPSFRKKGIASTLLNYAIKQSFLEGVEAICLQTLNKDKLLSFYQRFGFRKVLTKVVYSKDVF